VRERERERERDGVMPLVEDQLWILPPRVYVGVGNGRFRVSLSPYSRAPKHAQLLFLTHTHTVPHCSTPLFFAQTLHDLPTIAPPTPSFYFPTLSTLFSTHTRRVCAMRPPPTPRVPTYLHLLVLPTGVPSKGAGRCEQNRHIEFVAARN
jgi:hypothetical protein